MDGILYSLLYHSDYIHKGPQEHTSTLISYLTTHISTRLNFYEFLSIAALIHAGSDTGAAGTDKGCGK